MFNQQVHGGNGFGKKTATAGTVINRLVPAKQGAFTRLTKLVYVAGATAHTITVMRPLGRAKSLTASAASQAAIQLDRDPSPAGNTIAAADFVAVRKDDGTFLLDTVAGSGWNATTKTVTLSNNLAAALAAGADVWMFGVAADTEPATGEAHQGYTGTASVTTSYADDVAGVIGSHNQDEPLLVQSNNATAAGTIEQVSFAYTKN